MEIKWEDPPESAKRAGSRPGKYTEWANALKEHPDKWAKLPNEERRQPNTAAGLTQNIRRGKVKGFEGGRWETATEEGEIWVCYLGPKETTQTEASGSSPEADPDDEVTHARVSGATIRAWAKERGIDVPERGRLPYDIVEQYRATRLD